MTIWPARDDLPVVLVTLDGLGDRPCRSLAGATPAEAARTPILDALTARGAAGVHVPFGPGWATASERAHWAMFGLTDVAFPGRAALELLGVGGQPPVATPMWHLAIRSGVHTPDAVVITGRINPDDSVTSASAGAVLTRCAQVWNDQSPRRGGIRFGVVPLRVGEWALIGHGLVSHEVSDSDPLFDSYHPWMRPMVLREAEVAGGQRAEQAARTAAALEEFLLTARAALQSAGVAHDVPTTKWASWLEPSPARSGDGSRFRYADETGIPDAMVTSSALYRGFARLFGAREVDVPAAEGDDSLGLTDRITAAIEMLKEPSPPRFIHVHTKAPDEAGHTKDPYAKIAAIEACDAALEPLLRWWERGDVVVAVTGDHATPSETQLLHSGDPTPFVVAGPDVRVDDVQCFGETPMLQGSLGFVRAQEIAPLLHGLARRPFFIGHRPGPALGPGLPLSPPAMAWAGREGSPSIPPPIPQESHV